MEIKLINLYDVYKKVADRHREQEKKGVSEETLEKSFLMKKAAKEILEKPTLKRVKEFSKLEDIWWRSPEVSEHSKFISLEFEDVIRSKCFYIEEPTFNRAQTGWSAEEGLVYCISSTSKSGQVKIGATTMDLRKRLKKLKNRYKYSELNIEFAYRTNKVSNLEKLVHKELSPFLVSGRTKGDSVEWYFVTPAKANLTLRKIANLENLHIEKIKLLDKII